MTRGGNVRNQRTTHPKKLQRRERALERRRAADEQKRALTEKDSLARAAEELRRRWKEGNVGPNASGN